MMIEGHRHNIRICPNQFLNQVPQIHLTGGHKNQLNLTSLTRTPHHDRPNPLLFALVMNGDFVLGQQLSHLVDNSLGHLILDQTVLDGHQTMTPLSIKPSLNLPLDTSRLELQLGPVIFRLLHPKSWPQFIGLITCRLVFFQGLPQQIHLKIQLLIVAQMHELAAPTGLVNRTLGRNPKLGLLIDGQKPGLRKIALNSRHLTKNILTLESPWHKD